MHENAFLAAKEDLISAPVLWCPKFDLPFVIQTLAHTVSARC